jgi:RNA polymerase subunit RPABC4/transcription elongation factor Spt4
MKMTKKEKKVCSQCGDKRNVFWTFKNRHVRTDGQHDLCPKCAKSTLDSVHAMQLCRLAA